jgi:diguanylate cyclase (GGDEF)-like protein
MIGVLIGDISFEFSSILMAGIADAATAANSDVLYFLGMQKHVGKMADDSGGRDSINFNSVYDYANFAGADAFIIASGSLSGFSEDGLDATVMRRFADKPCVVLQERIETLTPLLTYVVIDNYTGYCKCIEHLITVHGYTKIGFVSGPKGHYDARARLRAYLDTMARYRLPVTESMITYGDFYEYVDESVASLMDGNTDLQAIAFANDEMAKAGYRECAKRGLVVGRDIAITGFDNLSFCHTMDPSLTTVSQEAYQIGRIAVACALRMLKGETVPPVEMQTEFIPRESCGCTRDNLCGTRVWAAPDETTLVDSTLACITSSFMSQFSQDEQDSCRHHLREYLSEVRSLVLSGADRTLEQDTMQRVCNTFMIDASQPINALAHSLQDALKLLMGQPPTNPIALRLMNVLYSMQQYLQRMERQSLSAMIGTLQLQSWIAPELTHGLYGQDNEDEVFRSVIDRLISLGFNNVYVCILDEPQYFSSTGLASIPQRLLLAGYGNRHESRVYSQGDMPVINGTYPFRTMPGFLDAGAMMGFSFFSGENQYGMLLCDVQVNKSTLLHVIGLQLGMLLDFLILRRKEKSIALELEDIREKNEILNFLSEYDLLCGLLNRRGFIERAIRMNRENIGKTAYCAFIDLDYLKQINDTYGHPEGDIALQTVSRILQRCATEHDLIGRIGGDEFVGMYLREEEGFQEKLQSCLRRGCDEYNRSSEKKYAVDISAGIVKFTCRHGLEVSGVIAEADQHLYAAKRSRTSTGLRLRHDGAHIQKME